MQRNLACRIDNRNQRGVALMVAMIALVVMALAGVALLRAVDTNALVAGNLAFRQSAVNAGDSGVESARTWLGANSAGLEQDLAASGYYASRMNVGGVDGKGIDLTGSRTTSTADDVKWVNADGSTQPGQYTPFCVAAKDEGGNKICYVIHRLCDQTGPLADAGCSSTYSATSGGGSAGTLQQGSTYQKTIVGEGTLMGFYRISVRVSGPRNNTGYVQAVVQY
ncbi:hypothetical protein VX159_14760 [Dechloromonas sp. ZY10]|uniref:pilus assembly PilX family protein n=1 Tax=Dechloromonas aquae TaxID=2664436 RepID=UPI003527D900